MKTPDQVTVVKMPPPGGIGSSWPQSYEITVKPGESAVPELPFLHKGDGITVTDGTTYWIQGARQVATRTGWGSSWSWVYTAHRQEEEGDSLDDDYPFGASKFGRD